MKFIGLNLSRIKVHTMLYYEIGPGLFHVANPMQILR